eukprot:1953980-Prymnesium_polylepis.1
MPAMSMNSRTLLSTAYDKAAIADLRAPYEVAARAQAWRVRKATQGKEPALQTCSVCARSCDRHLGGAMNAARAVLRAYR